MRLVKTRIGNQYVDPEGSAPPSPAEHFYVAFPLKTDEDAAAKRFETIHGFPPPWLFESLGNLLAGPLPAQKGVEL